MGKFTLLSRKDGAKSKAKSAAKSVAESASDALPDADRLYGPSPNAHTNLVIADVALRGGTLLARRAVERSLLGNKYTPRKARAILRGRSWSETLLHSAVARIAAGSVPGAIVVGGGLIAKTLYDRSKANQARAEGEIALHAKAEDGSK